MGQTVFSKAGALGVDENICHCYEWLCKEYEDSDQIVLVGFSRGAVISQGFGNLRVRFWHPSRQNPGPLNPMSRISVRNGFQQGLRPQAPTRKHPLALLSKASLAFCALLHGIPSARWVCFLSEPILRKPRRISFRFAIQRLAIPKPSAQKMLAYWRPFRCWWRSVRLPRQGHVCYGSSLDGLAT